MSSSDTQGGHKKATTYAHAMLSRLYLMKLSAAKCELNACSLRAFIDNDTWQYYHVREISC